MFKSLVVCIVYFCIINIMIHCLCVCVVLNAFVHLCPHKQWLKSLWDCASSFVLSLVTNLHHFPVPNHINMGSGTRTAILCNTASAVTAMKLTTPSLSLLSHYLLSPLSSFSLCILSLLSLCSPSPLLCLSLSLTPYPSLSLLFLHLMWCGLVA